MGVTTEVINKSDRELVLKEGNAGAYMKLATLEVKGPKCKYRIKCNTDATYREYWLGAGVGVKEGDQGAITISTDDCVECETIYIINDPNDRTKLTLDQVKRGSNVMTQLVNRTDGIAKMKFQSKGGELDEKEIPSNEKIFLQPGSKECTVKLADGQIIKISNEVVARNQRVDIIPGPGSRDANLDEVMRGLYLTEVTNRSSGEIQVKQLKGSGGAVTVLATLQKDEKCLIQYDPKKHDKYSVEYSIATPGNQVLNLTSSDFADFATIDVIDEPDEPGGMKALQRLLPRPTANKLKGGFVSRFLGLFGYKA